MPRLDGTGPEGAGPLTGRGLGNCKGSVRRRFAGMGRGFRNRFRRPMLGQRQTERQTLENERELLKEELQEIENRLSESEDR
ncbi:MAG: DUF5320 domain-containing protein [Patescibacteria group bacterium]